MMSMNSLMSHSLKTNHKYKVYRSKAVGEPPLMLALSVWCALRDGDSSIANYEINPPLDAPATPEAVFRAIQAVKVYRETRR